MQISFARPVETSLKPENSFRCLFKSSYLQSALEATVCALATPNGVSHSQPQGYSKSNSTAPGTNVGLALPLAYCAICMCSAALGADGAMRGFDIIFPTS
jgi:hypothetical protein